MKYYFSGHPQKPEAEFLTVCGQLMNGPDTSCEWDRYELFIVFLVICEWARHVLCEIGMHILGQEFKFMTNYEFLQKVCLLVGTS